ncbi:MAG: septum formation initiator family protein [Christensenella sp.]
MAKKKKTFNFNRIKIFVLIGVLVYAGLTFFNQQTILAAQQTKQQALIAEQAELKQQIDYYKNEQNYIGSDEWIEREARERLGWLKPGETKYVEPAADATAAPSPTAAPTPSSTPAATSEPAPSPTAPASSQTP